MGEFCLALGTEGGEVCDGQDEDTCKTEVRPPKNSCQKHRQALSYVFAGASNMPAGWRESATIFLLYLEFFLDIVCRGFEYNAWNHKLDSVLQEKSD